MMEELAEELKKMGMETQEPLWWTSTSGKEIKCHMKIKADKSWTVPFVDEFDILGHRYTRNGMEHRVQ